MPPEKEGQEPNDEGLNPNEDEAKEAPKTDGQDSSLNELDDLRKEIKELRREAASYRRKLRDTEDAQEKAKEQELEQKEEYKALSDKRQGRIEELERELERLKLKDLKREVAEAAGIPLQAAGRLNGESREELEADAEMLKQLFPAPELTKPNMPNINSDSVPPKKPDSSNTAKLTAQQRAYCDERGIPYEEYAKFIVT